jgi:hypothetical protein
VPVEHVPAVSATGNHQLGWVASRPVTGMILATHSTAPWYYAIVPIGLLVVVTVLRRRGGGGRGPFSGGSDQSGI